MRLGVHHACGGDMFDHVVHAELPMPGGRSSCRVADCGEPCLSPVLIPAHHAGQTLLHVVSSPCSRRGGRWRASLTAFLGDASLGTTSSSSSDTGASLHTLQPPVAKASKRSACSKLGNVDASRGKTCSGKCVKLATNPFPAFTVEIKGRSGLRLNESCLTLPARGGGFLFGNGETGFIVKHRDTIVWEDSQKCAADGGKVRIIYAQGQARVAGFSNKPENQADDAALHKYHSRTFGSLSPAWADYYRKAAMNGECADHPSTHAQSGPGTDLDDAAWWKVANTNAGGRCGAAQMKATDEESKECHVGQKYVPEDSVCPPRQLSEADVSAAGEEEKPDVTAHEAKTAAEKWRAIFAIPQNAGACQQLCKNTPECEFFNFSLKTGCHLQNGSATLVAERGAISGDADCQVDCRQVGEHLCQERDDCGWTCDKIVKATGECKKGHCSNEPANKGEKCGDQCPRRLPIGTEATDWQQQKHLTGKGPYGCTLPDETKEEARMRVPDAPEDARIPCEPEEKDGAATANAVVTA